MTEARLETLVVEFRSWCEPWTKRRTRRVTIAFWISLGVLISLAWLLWPFGLLDVLMACIAVLLVLMANASIYAMDRMPHDKCLMAKELFELQQRLDKHVCLRCYTISDGYRTKVCPGCQIPFNGR